jgi:NAD(P)-dependent dehydrogenase (short-subunit alcohol dehydrogenase family)
MAYSGFSLGGKIAVVIGGTTGIGRAIALGFAEAGADVIATSRRRELVEEVTLEIQKLGRESIAITTDATDRAALERLEAQVSKHFGRFDILVNSQGTTSKKAFLEVGESEWQDVMDANLTSIFRSCQVIGRRLVAEGGGRIINIGSLASSLSFPEVASYCVSKAGVVMLTRVLACEWARFNVNVNAIAPGICRTSLNAELLDIPERGGRLLSRVPMGRFGDVSELAGAAIYLASEASRYVTGAIMTVDGGYLANGM